MSNIATGKTGEKLAAKYLQSKGYKIVVMNFYTHWGEIDIIALKDQKLTFIEIKTRFGDKFGKPHASVNFHKMNHLKRPIQHFLLKNDYKNYKLSLDVVSIELNTDQTVKILKHFENVGTY